MKELNDSPFRSERAPLSDPIRRIPMERTPLEEGRGHIIPLSEGRFSIDKSKHFVPFNEHYDEQKSRKAGSLLVEVQPFVVVTFQDVLLLDTGLGFTTDDGGLQIHQNLLNAGIDPGNITKVLLTHLHKDHAGGVSTGNNHRSLSFPNAVYYVQENELNFAFEKGVPSYIPEELEILKHASNVVLLSEEEGVIDNYIHYKVTGAHSKFHQVFWIKNEGETIFFGGDDAPRLQQMKHRIVAKYDYDGKKTMELRSEWLKKGKEEQWSFLFYHDIKTGVHRF